jgi:hypothetical protein
VAEAPSRRRGNGAATSRATEKDLMHELQENLPATVRLPRPIHDNAFTAPLRFKTLSAWLPAIRSSSEG